MSVPVLIISHNRAHKLKSLLEQCFKNGIRTFYVAIDGSLYKNQAVQLAYQEVLKNFKVDKQIDLIIWHREKNIGLMSSMITAIDWFFSKEDSGIILEDDLVISQESINFFNEGLRIYQTNSDIFLISGNQFFTGLNPVGGVSVCNYPLIWGWATWKNQWLKFRSSLSEEIKVQSKLRVPLKVRFFLEISYIRAQSRKINSWAIVLAVYMRFKNLICVCPNVNLISNIGFDTFATHTIVNDWPLDIPISNFGTTNFKIDGSLNLNYLIESSIYRVKDRHILFIFSIVLKKIFNRNKFKIIDELNNVQLPKIN